MSREEITQTKATRSERALSKQLCFGLQVIMQQPDFVKRHEVSRQVKEQPT